MEGSRELVTLLLFGLWLILYVRVCVHVLDFLVTCLNFQFIIQPYQFINSEFVSFELCQTSEIVVVT